jgi:hypothetical protein
LILVVEPAPTGTRFVVRVVLEEDDEEPTSLEQIRHQLRLAEKDLPNSISMVPMKRFPDRRNKK